MSGLLDQVGRRRSGVFTLVAQTCTVPVDRPPATVTLTVWAAVAVVVSMMVE